MLDLNFVRENLDAIREALSNRNFPADTLDHFIGLDETRRRVIGEADALNAQRNAASKEIGGLIQAGKKDEADTKKAEVSSLKQKQADLEAQRDDAERQMHDLLAGLPNLPATDVPIGKDEAANVEVRRWGTPREFDFEPKDHVDLGEALGILDLERATKIAGSRFSIFMGAGARLERALINFMLDLHTTEHGFTETVPPFIVNQNALFGSGQLPKFAEDLFHLQDDRGLTLIPTSEVPLVNYYSGEILNAADLPRRLTAYSPCFRSEAGSYGRDTRGVIRLHQFEKVEMITICKPEESDAELAAMTSYAEKVLELLNLPFRTVTLSTGDMGFSANKTYDIEVWLPSQKTYREISSCSNCGDFQARRMNLRFRRSGDSKPEFAHTLNGSGLALSRTWVALVENYQQADGSVVIPEVLRPFMGGAEVLTA